MPQWRGKRANRPVTAHVALGMMRGGPATDVAHQIYGRMDRQPLRHAAVPPGVVPLGNLSVVTLLERRGPVPALILGIEQGRGLRAVPERRPGGDRKSTRLNSSHQIISYAVFCLKK